jgi:hypothetical protein
MRALIVKIMSQIQGTGQMISIFLFGVKYNPIG